LVHIEDIWLLLFLFIREGLPVHVWSRLGDTCLGCAGGDLEATAGNILNRLACIPQKDYVADTEWSLVGMYCRYI